MNSQSTAIRATTNNSINEVFYSDIKSKSGPGYSYIKLEEVRKITLRKIGNRVEALLMEAFNDATEYHEKQGIIEAAQDLGHLELSIEFMDCL